MQESPFTIYELQAKSNLPFELLLLADETKEAIEKYIYDSDVYVLAEEENESAIAVFVLHKNNDTEIEIKNIAVLESLQGKGVGTYLINYIKKIASEKKFKSIIAGTPDTASGTIKFYEKMGFVKYHVKKDFFVENYAEPIVENGIQLKDMVMLKLILS